MKFKQDILRILPDDFELDCNVNLSNRGLTELPDFSKVVVNGNFNCLDNYIENLVGAPQKASGDFLCNANRIKSLNGAPKVVGGLFNCAANELKTRLADTESKILKSAQTIKAVVLKGFDGMIGREVQPGRRFGTEIASYAKKRGVSGIFHSDELPAYGITQDEVDKVT